MRNRKLMALMQAKGRVSLDGNFGKDLDWKVKFKRAPLQGFADGDVVSFARRDRFRTARLDWRGYNLTDLQSKLDRLKNRGTAAIIDLYSEILDSMVDDIEEGFADEMYKNGYAAGNTRGIHGIESFLQGTAAAGRAVATPTSTYAGLSCTPGAHGGNWNGNWPSGSGDAHYDFWSPILVDYTSTYWGGSDQSWAKNCNEAIRFMLIKGRKSKSRKGMMDLILLNDDLYEQFLNTLDDKQRLNVNRNEKVGLVALGFTDTVNFDGCDVTTEYGVPLNTGYAFNTSQMELMSLQQGRLFVPTGPVFSEETSTYRVLIDYYGNMKFNPRGQGKFYPYT
jgi:hypothetical protein